MMSEIKMCEALYPTAGWHKNVKIDYSSDSGASNYSSSHSLHFMGELRSGTVGHLEEGKSSTADDTEASQTHQNSVMNGDLSSVTSLCSKSSPQKLARHKQAKPVPTYG